jgi:serine kinase of HPr protein (carbohydrate metabolism regulator)
VSANIVFVEEVEEKEISQVVPTLTFIYEEDKEKEKKFVNATSRHKTINDIFSFLEVNDNSVLRSKEEISFLYDFSDQKVGEEIEKVCLFCLKVVLIAFGIYCFF